MVNIGSYNKTCKTTLGGIKEIYIAPYVKYTKSQIASFEMQLTTYPASDFYLYDVNGSYTQDSSFEGGAYFNNQSVDFQIARAYENFNVLPFLKQDYRAIVKTNNDQLIMFGVYNGMAATINNNSGSGKQEFNGFSVSLKGKEIETGLLIADLSDLGITVIDDFGFLNFDLNFGL